MIKGILIVTALLIAGAFLNSQYSPTRSVVDRIVTRTVEFVENTTHTGAGLVGDVTSEVKVASKKQ